MRGTEGLLDVLNRKPRRLRELLLGRLTTQFHLEPAGRTRQLLLAFDDVHGHPDRARVVRDGALHRLADPPRRVRRELEATAPVELLDGAIEPECPLLDQIEERHAEPAVPLRDRDDETEVRFDHAALRNGIASLDPLRERHLVGGGQQPVATDIGEEQLQRVGCTRKRLGGPYRRFGLLLLALGVGKQLLRVGVGLRLPDLEPDRLELTRDLLGLLVVQFMLEDERLELDRIHPAALLRARDQTLDLIGFEQFGQLALRQEAVSVLSRTPVCTIFHDSMLILPWFPGVANPIWAVTS